MVGQTALKTSCKLRDRVVENAFVAMAVLLHLTVVDNTLVAVLQERESFECQDLCYSPQIMS
jgi:hypothetical protein